MKSRQLALLIFSLMIVPNVGCQSWYRVRDTFYFCEPIDEAIHGYNCHCAAKRAWKARFDRYCDRNSVDHFGAGFRAGYADVAMGKPGCVPPLPPRRYWGWRYQNCEGQQCVAGWFDGYPAGARAAEEDGVSNWSRMQTSYLIDAQYASRMPGNRRGGPVPPGVAFPGEELEEVPASQLGTHETRVTSPLQGEPEVEAAPVETPAAPQGTGTPEAEAPGAVGVLRTFDETPATIAKIVKAPIRVLEAAPITVAAKEEIEAPAAVAPIVQAPIVEAPIRKFDMPAVELLSGVSVPKKQSASVQEAPQVEITETMPLESSDEAVEEVAAPTTAEVVKPVLRRLEAPTAGVVSETPAYSLGDEASKADVAPTPVSASQVKRTLPPIIPSKSKKQPAPIVRPVEEQGRFTKLESPLETKQVSFENEEDEETPVLRRIGKSK